MGFTRRTFLKAGTVGGGRRSRFRSPRSAGRDARVQDLAHDGNAQHVSVLLRLVRRHHPHARRPGQERHGLGRPRGGRSGPPDQPRDALPEGDHAQGGHPARAPAHEARWCGAPGSDKWEDISWDDAIAGIAKHVKATRDRCFVEKNAKGQTVNRNPGIVMIGGCTDTNEFNFLQWKAGAVLRRHVPGHPGTGMTRPDGGQSGRHVRARGDDERMGRHQERRRRLRHGRKSRREPPVRLQVGDRGHARRVTRRSSRSTRASTGPRPWPTSTPPSAPARTSLTSAASSVTRSRRTASTRTTSRSTRTRRTSSPTSTPSTTGSSPAGTRARATTTRAPGPTRPTRRRRPTSSTRRSRTRAASSSS